MDRESGSRVTNCTLSVLCDCVPFPSRGVTQERTAIEEKNGTRNHTVLARTTQLLIIMGVVRDTTVVVSTVSATTRHDRFFYLPTKDLAPFSIHIPTKKPSFTLINDFVVESYRS